MASLHCLPTRALLDVTSRRMLSATFYHSAVLSSAALSAGQFEAPSVPEIFDIFDAPVRLRERKHADAPLKPLSTARVTTRAGPSHSKSIYSDALGLPWSLPPPITFDGPARPPHMSSSALRKRHLQRQNLAPSRGIHGRSAVSFSAFVPQSQPLYQLFDGPSRRYQYPTPHNQGYSFTYVSLVLCISSAFGWFLFKDNLGLQRVSKILAVRRRNLLQQGASESI